MYNLLSGNYARIHSKSDAQCECVCAWVCVCVCVWLGDSVLQSSKSCRSGELRRQQREVELASVFPNLLVFQRRGDHASSALILFSAPLARFFFCGLWSPPSPLPRPPLHYMAIRQGSFYWCHDIVRRLAVLKWLGVYRCRFCVKDAACGDGSLSGEVVFLRDSRYVCRHDRYWHFLVPTWCSLSLGSFSRFLKSWEILFCPPRPLGLSASSLNVFDLLSICTLSSLNVFDLLSICTLSNTFYF